MLRRPILLLPILSLLAACDTLSCETRAVRAPSGGSAPAAAGPVHRALRAGAWAAPEVAYCDPLGMDAATAE